MCSITLQSNNPEEGDYTQIRVRIRCEPTATSFIQDASFSISGRGPLLHPHWDDFEDSFLRLTRQKPLELDLGESEMTVNSIMRGEILTRVDLAGRLRLTRGRGIVTRDALVSTPLEHTSDGTHIRLTPFQHFRMMTCRDMEAEDYLEKLVEEYKAKNLKESEWMDGNDGDMQTMNSDGLT